MSPSAFQQESLASIAAKRTPVSAAPKRSIREHPAARRITRHEVLQLLDNAAREGDDREGPRRTRRGHVRRPARWQTSTRPCQQL